ncbi:MAG: putative signal transducing protein, partial [Fidelibacterota bacterium]
QVTLVSELPGDQPMEEIRWVPLQEFPSQMYAEMARESLENEGIPSYLKADFLTTTYGVKGGALAGSQAALYVPEDQLDRAKNILKQMLDTI